jgi:sulfatase modifying factor 1
MHSRLRGSSALIFCHLFAVFVVSAAGAEDGTLSKRSGPPRFEGGQVVETREDNGLKMKLIWCPSGKFLKGSPLSEEYRQPSERQVEITLPGFWLGMHELTQAQWKGSMGSRPWTGKTGAKEGPDFPAYYVSWLDAVEFCKKLTRDERAAGRLPADCKYDLPTEAQWEYACRAGTTTAFPFGDTQQHLADYAWFGSSTHDLHHPGSAKKDRYAHPIGQKRPNPWGFFDMHGNVWEWCLEVRTYDPPNPVAGRPLAALRGGSFRENGRYCRSAFSTDTDKDFVSDNVGFRVALIRPTPQQLRSDRAISLR